MIRCCLILPLLGIGSAGFLPAQSTSVARRYQNHGTLTYKHSKLVLQVNSSRPVEQALSQLRRKYGIVLDYEEGSSNDPTRISSTGNQRRWIVGRYTIRIHAPSSPDFAASQHMISETLSQFRASGAQHFISIIGTHHRITVAPSTASARILDTPIVIPVANRTVDQAIEAILAAVSRQIGKPFERGGIADNGTATAYVTIGSTTPITARLLLAKALDAVPYRRFWVQGWEPGSDTYFIAIQAVVRTEITPSGSVREIPIYK